MAAPVLRPKQERLADSIRVAFRRNSRVLAVAHTAFGKTVLFSYIVCKAEEKGNRILILAHRQELISQISGALRKFGVRHGIIAPQYTPDYSAKVQVASIGTMNARFQKIPDQTKDFDLVILDESHHLLASNTFGKVYDLLGSPRLLGVTATPERADGKGLGEGQGGVFQEMVLGPSVRESIDDGYLSDFVVYAPLNRIDVSDIKTKMGDYDRKELAERVDRPTITGDAVKEYARICPTYPTVVFCVSIEHCHHVAAEFQSAGFDFRVIDGSMDDTTRKNLISGLGTTHLGLVSCDIISEGTDVPSIACAIFLRPTKSTGLYIQQAGRAIRPVYAEGYDLLTKDGRLAALANGPKPKAVLIDCAGLTFMHGMIDDDREWSLEGRQKKPGKKKASEPAVKMTQCIKCFAVFSPDAGKFAADKIRGESDPEFPHTACCPNCSHPIEFKGRQVAHEEGELQEITPEMAERMRKQKRREMSSARSLEDLLRIAAQRGYSSGWAQQVYNSRLRKQEKEQAAILAARIDKMIAVFARFDVTVAMLEQYLTHDVKLVDEAELDRLTVVYNKIKTGTPVNELFPASGGDQPVF